MLAGLPYRAAFDGLPEERLRCKQLIYKYNNLEPSQRGEMRNILHQLLGGHGERFSIGQPFHCDYGWNIFLGEGFGANYNLTILDVGRVTFGDNVMIGPNVSIFTAGHPIHPETRNTHYEYGIPITVGSNVWIGGGSIILPGVTIGDNTVIGAGSVVTKDIPANVVAVGNPCRPIKTITDADKDIYFRDVRFDEEGWEDACTLMRR